MNNRLDEIIIAHRGESFIAPENSLASINLAWQHGVKAVEIDVQLTADDQIVVIHDKSTKRTGNYDLSINASTLTDLRTIDIGLFKGIKWKGEIIPTLTEVLNTVPEDGKLVIEIKSGEGIIKPLSMILNQSNLRSAQIEIISFDLSVLSGIKKLIPEYSMLWLLDLDYYLPKWLLLINKKKLIRTVLKNNFDGVDVWAGKIIDESFINLFKSHKLLVYTWTVNDPRKAEILINMGVDAITTDRPEWIKKQILGIKS